MCAGGGGSRYIPLDKRSDADLQKIAGRPNIGNAKRAQQILAEREQIRQQMEALAAERNAAANAQAKQLMQLEKQGQKMATEAAAQQDLLNKQQQEKVAGIRASGTAVSQSLRILGQQAPTAPTASMSRPARAASAPRAYGASLQIGSQRRGSGSGANLSV